MKYSKEQIDDTKLPSHLLDKLTHFEISMLMSELSNIDKQMMGYFPIEDNNSNFDLVEIKTTHTKVQLTPHCKIHGAMNCVAVFEGGKLWRCLQSNQVKDCRAGCEEKYEKM